MLSKIKTLNFIINSYKEELVLERIEIPVAIIGDNILGTLMSRAFAEKKIDNVLVGQKRYGRTEITSASLKNMSSFQSGILQAYYYRLEQFEADLKAHEEGDNGEKMTDFIREIKMSRDDLLDISDKIKDYFLSDKDGILNIPDYTEENIESYQKKVKLLGYGPKYRKAISDESVLREKLGALYDEGKDNYFYIPDGPFEIDKLIYFLKKDLINVINKKKVGNSFLFEVEKDSITIARNENKFLITNLCNYEIEANHIILCAGFNNYRLYREIMDGLAPDLVENLRGFCLVKSEEFDGLQMNIPFFSRMESNNVINICKQGSVSLENLDLLVSTSNVDIRLNGDCLNDSYRQIYEAHENRINEHFGAIQDTLQNNIGVQEVRHSLNSFCIHLYGRQPYSGFINHAIEHHITSVHPGLATGAYFVVKKTLARLKESVDFLKKSNLSKANRMKMQNETNEFHKKIKNLRNRDINANSEDLKISWFKA